MLNISVFHTSLSSSGYYTCSASDKMKILCLSAGSLSRRRGCGKLATKSFVPRISPKKGNEMTTTRSHGLRRSRSNRIIAGVCGGLAEFFGISAFWFRLLFFISLIPGGVPGVLIYLIAMIVIPGE